MGRNDVTGDSLISRASTDAFRDGWDRIFQKRPPFKCIYCGRPSWHDPADQSPPPDYCHESDHGEQE